MNENNTNEVCGKQLGMWLLNEAELEIEKYKNINISTYERYIAIERALHFIKDLIDEEDHPDIIKNINGFIDTLHILIFKNDEDSFKELASVWVPLVEDIIGKLKKSLSLDN